ncbi:unnamed protein product, partial [Brassica oleracea var. botrytis]
SLDGGDASPAFLESTQRPFALKSRKEKSSDESLCFCFMKRWSSSCPLNEHVTFLIFCRSLYGFIMLLL